MRETTVGVDNNKKNILIYEARDIPGNQIVGGLAEAQHNLLLCGTDRDQQQQLAARHNGAVAGISRFSWGSETRDMMDLQSMVEAHGSLDALIYLLAPEFDMSFLLQSSRRIGETFERQLARPIRFLHALFPYLRKTASRVIFIDTAFAYTTPPCSEVGRSSRYGLWGFCETVKPEFQERGIDIRCISLANVLAEVSAVSPELPGKLSARRCSNLVREVVELVGIGEVRQPSTGAISQA